MEWWFFTTVSYGSPYASLDTVTVLELFQIKQSQGPVILAYCPDYLKMTTTTTTICTLPPSHPAGR